MQTFFSSFSPNESLGSEQIEFSDPESSVYVDLPALDRSLAQAFQIALAFPERLGFAW